jgi:alpha-galactosidase
MNRSNFIRVAGVSLASFLMRDFLFANSSKGSIMNLPDEATAILDDQLVTLTGRGESWTYKDLVVTLHAQGEGLAVDIDAPRSGLTAVTLRWKLYQTGKTNLLNDHWERTYGDVSWHTPSESEILPWYFMEHDGGATTCFGVKTGTASFCGWQVGKEKVSLTMDTRSGGSAVHLAGRTLRAAQIVTTKSVGGESPFQTGRRFMKMMCEHVRMPSQPVYGINDWYFTYGDNSADLILEHTKLMAPMAEGLANRPFSVIDAGWFVTSPDVPKDSSWGDRLDIPNAKFGDMSTVAARIRAAGMRPGIWTRPLCGGHDDPPELMLPLIKGRDAKTPVLDPTIPENLERIGKLFKVYNSWNYDLVKFDYTTFDLYGKWGFEMMRDGAITSSGWRMHDNSRTNAEIILDLYKTIRKAAGSTYVLSCNTVSHLSAGLFELNRIGDDTSGNEWARTRKMGVNTLAFRGLHHGIFYASDPDCVGLTTKVPWEKNKQWMKLVANSSTPLFISAQREAVGADQRTLIKESFASASRDLPVGEPLDWMENAFPKRWRLNGEETTFDWS